MSSPSPLRIPFAVDIRVERQTTPPGPVRLDAAAEHRIKLHTGRAVTGTCDRQRFRYTHGDVDLLPAGSADAWEEDQGSTSVLLHFAPALLRRTADELGLDGTRVGLQPHHQFRDARIAHLAWALDADHRAGQPSGRLYTDSLSTALLAHLAAQHHTLQSPAQGLAPSRLQRVTEYIDAHLDQDLSLACLARVANLSPSHLKTQFKRATGSPVHAHVIRRRVERARELLLRRDLPASQIALEAGFAHQSHMMRTLRRVLGDASVALLRGSGPRRRG
ncbi:AraC family transcriptional regulator [Marilutibacter chinensis]|uniref:AraC family transcriptional regulator n=1 Tax=Marilutibacter chinensis TaxID=2912247 RepID=A0ABS9HYD1_9GAMM|nr:AraC family transcriptional regulator [Lysobacter chinensis]MCF7223392.1 AraC family transcriptional regulator [Lysobacter chinensis]